MKVLHITPTYYPATYWGGPIYSVYGLCNAVAKMPGVVLKVLTTDASSPRRSDSVATAGFPALYPGGYEVFFSRRWCGASFSPGMLLRLWPMIRWADVVHLTAVYSPSTIPTLLLCRLLGKPMVWSPRGALQRWEGTTKPIAKGGWERICNALISPKNCILHVTSEQEGLESHARISNAAVTIVPNGVDFPEALPPREWLPGGILRLLYIGRLHAKKGIENLLWALTHLGKETVSLAIYGTGEEAYLLQLRDLVRRIGLQAWVTFQGHIDGDRKLDAFMQADVCMVPSFTENFGMVVAESLAHAVPVIASQGTPWGEMEKRSCGFWVENKPAVLADAIRRIRTKDLQALGETGRNWMRISYSWNSIAQRMLNVYEELLNQRS